MTGLEVRATSTEPPQDQIDRQELLRERERDDYDAETPTTATNELPKIGTLHLAVLIFYSVSGGPFGIEPAVRSGGALFTLLGFFVLTLIWCVPEALVTAELSTTFPEDGSGGVVWVEQAFGSPMVAYMIGCLSWIAGATDNAIYPGLFLDYLFHDDEFGDNHIHITWNLRLVLLFSMSVILIYINHRGLEWVGNVSLGLCFMTMSPFVVFCLVGMFKVDPQRWLQTPPPPPVENNAAGCLARMMQSVYWRPFLNNLFWNLNYFDGAASFAADVRQPSVVFPRAMLMAVFLVVLGYMLPLLVALGAAETSPEDWVDGFMATVVSRVVHPWLGAWVVLAAGVANLGLFQAEFASDALKLCGMAQRGYLPPIFARRHARYGTPTYAILLGGIVVMALCPMQLNTLLELLNFHYVISILMEYAAFLKLRISQPHLHRPYKIPLPTWACILMLIPCVGMMLVVMALASCGTYIACLATMTVATLLYSLRHSLWTPAMESVQPEEDDGDDD